MTTPERPLDARRAQLRTQGYTDDEISRAFAEEIRQSSQPQAAASGSTGGGGVAGQTGVMSGVLNNLSVAMALATGFLPSVATDIANLFGGHGSLHERSRAGVFLAAKLALVAAISFAIYQEYQKHIFSETSIAAEQARKVKAEADAAEADAQAKNYNQLNFDYCKLPDDAKQRFRQHIINLEGTFTSPDCSPKK